VVYVDAQFVRDRIDEVREAIGRTVYFHVSTLTPCVLCVASGYYDSTNNTTLYFNCPVCDGQYYMPGDTITPILARIHWSNDEQITATPAGKYYVGDAYIHIAPENLELAEAAQSERGKVVVDNHDMYISKILPQGAPTINRYRLILRGMGDRPSD